MVIEGKGKNMHVILRYDEEKGVEVDLSKISNEEAILFLDDVEIRTKVNLGILDYIRNLNISEDTKNILIENHIDNWASSIFASELSKIIIESEEEEKVAKA